jgi:hypothetical protein
MGSLTSASAAYTDDDKTRASVSYTDDGTNQRV